MSKNKENIIGIILIALILLNSFMSYRNFMIAREANRISRSEFLDIQQHAAYINNLVYLLNGGSIPTLDDLNKMVAQKQAELQTTALKK